LILIQLYGIVEIYYSHIFFNVVKFDKFDICIRLLNTFNFFIMMLIVIFNIYLRHNGILVPGNIICT